MLGTLALLVAFVASGVGAIVLIRRRPADTLTQFRRQIDALSAESRRTVVSQGTPHGTEGVSGSSGQSTADLESAGVEMTGVHSPGTDSVDHEQGQVCGDVSGDGAARGDGAPEGAVGMV